MSGIFLRDGADDPLFFIRCSQSGVDAVGGRGGSPNSAEAAGRVVLADIVRVKNERTQYGTYFYFCSVEPVTQLITPPSLPLSCRLRHHIFTRFF